MNNIFKVNDNTWRVEDSGVRFFVLEGENEALMIDTGMNTPDARKIAQEITKLPLKLLNTHADPDHISGNGAFEEFYMSPNEQGNLEAHNAAGRIVPVSDGDIIDLGGRELKIIDLPGHTPGSIAVLDVKAKALFGGDSIQDGRIFMFGGHRNMDLYIKTLSELWENHKEEFSVVYPSHGTPEVNPEIIPRLISAAKDIQSGTAKGVKTDFFGSEIYYYDFGFAGFLCDK